MKCNVPPSSCMTSEYNGWDVITIAKDSPYNVESSRRVRIVGDHVIIDLVGVEKGIERDQAPVAAIS